MAPAGLFYHRFVRPDDLPALEAASAGLFAFDPAAFSLAEAVHNPERWFCLAAVAAGAGGAGERIVGFVAAALGQVGEFPEERPFLEAALGGRGGVSAGAAAPPAPAAARDGAGAAAPGDAPGAPTGGVRALEVVLLGVVPEFRRRGVATRLLKQVKVHARTRGAALCFLHVQSSNTPARRLYAAAGFAPAAVLRGYYADAASAAQRGQLRRSTAAGAATQAALFAGSDAELLVLLLRRAAVEAPAGTAPPPGAAVVPAAGGEGGPRPADRQPQQQRQREPAPRWVLPDGALQQGAPPDGGGSADGGRPAITVEAAAEAATAAAAAAARLLLGPAASGPRGELVRVGDELLVQVRSGGGVVMCDADELPPGVVLSERDRALLAAQRARQAELAGTAERARQEQEQEQRGQQQQQQQQEAGGSGERERDDEDGGSGDAGGGGAGVPATPRGVAAAAVGGGQAASCGGAAARAMSATLRLA
ncbi:ard1 [Scenedesmus sp. PABB004]|nr:ard1 [Scenedesmus sp. PABB004]